MTICATVGTVVFAVEGAFVSFESTSFLKTVYWLSELDFGNGSRMSMQIYRNLSASGNSQSRYRFIFATLFFVQAKQPLTVT